MYWKMFFNLISSIFSNLFYVKMSLAEQLSFGDFGAGLLHQLSDQISVALHEHAAKLHEQLKSLLPGRTFDAKTLGF